MEAQKKLNEAEMVDVQLDGLRDAIPNRLAREFPNFFVEYGSREDDGAMVFHFYTSRDHCLQIRSGGIANGSLWDDTYNFTARLDRGLAEYFERMSVSGGYTPEFSSFYVIVSGLGNSLDPWPLVARFLDGIDAPLVDA